ncbi:MAG: Abi family protein, partial [Deltaproteobacteria bacterium]|nr:Abi family protein [Deltaproteobacteria bacterium]
MTRPYTKRPLSIDDQLKRLEQREVVFGDRAAAKRSLVNTNYYKLSGYWHIFKAPDETFVREDAFDLAVQLHALDLDLRGLVLSMVGRLEVAFRSRVAHRLAMKHGTFAHEEDQAWAQRDRKWKSQSQVASWRETLHRETERSTDAFAKHFEREYQEWPMLPVWVACELMSFGTLSRLFKGMTTEDRAAVAEPFSIHHKVLASWLHMLSYTRNIAAHQGRLWNRTFSIKGMVPRSQDWQDLGVGRQLDRTYGAL